MGLNDLNYIITNLGHMLPQLSGFIDQFHNVVNQSNISVTTDSLGNMSMEVPANMTDIDANNIRKKIEIIDRLINSQGSKINDIFKKGLELEEQIKVTNPSYSSQLTDKISYFKALNASYKH